MKIHLHQQIGAALFGAAILAGAQPLAAASPATPKPLSESINRGLEWLAGRQHPGGGWSVGSDGPGLDARSRELIHVPDVADTCMAVLAFLRADNSPTEGDYAPQIVRGIEFVCSQVEASDETSMFVTDVRGTKIQQKLGTYADTFFAAQTLSEVRGRMPDEAANARVDAAARKVLAKMEAHQNEDGTWDERGWATALSQKMASKGMNRAMLAGFAVSEPMRERAADQGKSIFDSATGAFRSDASAGVDLYAAAASLTAAQENVTANSKRKDALAQAVAAPASRAESEAAERELSKIAEAESDLDQVRSAVAAKLADDRFVAGFGTNGGEEFLSYLAISESLALEGGETWEAWDRRITENLENVQEPEGWWGGKHCITGGTFCTAAALLVLTADRSPQAVGVQ